jgi:soluble lytic murein transglycosylase-like protein
VAPERKGSPRRWRRRARDQRRRAKDRPQGLRDYGTEIQTWAEKFGVPCELIIATICTESSGNPRAIRTEPGYQGDEKTPHKISVGLMQTLISTARDTLGEDTIDRDWLLAPGNAIRAGTAYIASQFKVTHFDPPKVACAYNAGNIYYDDAPGNRWKMRQYPIGTGEHADRFVKWYNDCPRLFVRDHPNVLLSFHAALHATEAGAKHA